MEQKTKHPLEVMAAAADDIADAMQRYRRALLLVDHQLPQFNKDELGDSAAAYRIIAADCRERYAKFAAAAKEPVGVLAMVLAGTIYSNWPKPVIRCVQKLVGVTADGIVGPVTRHAVRVWANKHRPGSS